MSKLIKNYLYNSFYQLFLIIIPLVTAPYLARVLGAKQLGIYSYVNSVSSIVTNIGLLGLNNYGIRQIAYCKDDKQKLNNIFFQLSILRILLLIVVSFIYFVLVMKSNYKIYFIIQYLIIFSVFVDCSWLMIGLEDMPVVVVRNFFAKLVTTLGIFVLVKSSNDLINYFLIFSISTFITTISLFFYIKKYINVRILKFHFSKSNLKVNLLNSMILFFPQMATLMYLQVDKIMLKFLTSSTAQVSFYDQAEKIVSIPLALITALGTVMMPRIAFNYKKGNYNEIKRNVEMVTQFGLFLSIPMVIGISSIAFYLIPWYLGENFYCVSYAIIIIAPIIILNTLTNISGTQYFTATDQTKIMTLSYSVAAVLNMIINWILIPNYGYIGAAIATLISSLVSVLIQYYVFNKQINIMPVILHSWKQLISGIIMGIVSYLIGAFMKTSPITTLVQILCGIVVYILILYIFKDKSVKIYAKYVMKKIGSDKK